MPKHRRMKYSQSFLQLLCSCLSLLGKVIKIQQSNLYVTSNFRLWLTILKMGSITFFGGCSHWNRDRSNILFRSHWLLSSTSYRPSVLQGLEGVRFINHLPETIPTGKLYFRSLVFKSLDEVRKSSPIFSPKQRKSLRSDVNFLWGMLLTLFSKFLAIDWS